MTAPSADPRVALAGWLAGPASRPAQAAASVATEESGGDPVTAATRLRRARPELDARRAAAVLEQAELRAIARQRYGIDASALLLSRDGLEQATRPEVAAHRAGLLVESGAQRVLDLTGGLGFDVAAFAAAGMTVTAFERDPVTAVLLAHNCPSVDVVAADATDPDLLRQALAALAATDVVFVDPARRDPLGARGANLRARPERDPALWSPPWPLIDGLPHPRIAAKVAPSFRAPPGWHAEWVSVHRTIVECGVYSWPLFDAARRAAVWTGAEVTVIDAGEAADRDASHPAARWLHEPDPAVVRAGAVASVLKSEPALWAVDGESSWLASADDVTLPFLRSFAVVEELQGSGTSQRRQLDRHGIDALSVKSRDAGVARHAVLRELDRPEGNGHVLVVTRRRGRTVRILCEPARQQSA